MVSTKFLNNVITISCLVGLGLSIYAYIVELNLEQNKNYEAMCDISEHMSCTKAFKSEWSKGFGLFAKDSFFNKPNSLLGILFFSLIATLAQSNSLFIARVSYWAVFLSNLASIYFAYILYFKLYDFCIVCVATYVVNALNLVAHGFKVSNLQAQEEIESKKKAR